MNDRPFAPLEERLGYRFAGPGLLQRALTHGSYAAEHPADSSNERLEFLGDAVLSLLVTDRIFSDYGDFPEGELAKVRAFVVSGPTLAECASRLGLGEFVLLGRGEEQAGGREKPSILADALEAVIAAVYVDGGLDAARRLVEALLGDDIVAAAKGPGEEDYKTRLQELALQLLHEPPRYEVRGAGPDHAREFSARVWLSGDLRGEGEGSTKKEAEQQAARRAWESLRERLVRGGGPGDG